MKYRILMPDEILKPGDQYLDGTHWYNTQYPGLTAREACRPFERMYRRPVDGKGKDGE